MPERLAEQLAQALGVDVVSPQLGADRGPCILGGEQRLRWIERYPEQVLQAHHLAQALDLVLGVQAVLTRHPRGCLGRSMPISS